MKEVGQALTALGILCSLAGFAFAVSLSAPAVEIIFFKSFLSDALGKSGYEVRWENVERVRDGKLAMNVSTQPAKQENVQVAHFGEYSNQLVVFVEKGRTVNNATETTIISGTQMVLPWPDLAVLSRVFPSSDVQQVAERIRIFQRSAFVYTLVSSVLLLSAGEMAKRAARMRRKTGKGGKRVSAVRSQQAKPALLHKDEALSLALETPVLAKAIGNGHGGQEASADEWPALFSRIEEEVESAQGEMREKLDRELAALRAETRPGRRIKKAWHLLYRIQEIRDALSRKIPEVGEAMPAPVVRQRALPSSGVEQISRALLSVDSYIPPDMDPDTVRKVLLAFLRPGNRVPVLGGEYTSLTELSKHLKGIPPEKVDDVLGWLEGIGVLWVREHKKRGKKLLSLMIHAHGVASPGREVIGIIKNAAFEKTRMG